MNRHVVQAIRYAALPGILPRLREFNLNFGYIAYLMAIIFSIVRLLPDNHPYLSAANMEKFGIRQVMAAAAHNLKGGVRNIDQYLIFGGFLLGTVLLILQFVLLFAAIIIHGAEASGFLGDFRSIFRTPNPDTDIAFLMLDSVFHVPNFFVGNGTSPIPPFALGLQQLFAFYSRGMLMIAALIVLYYIFVMIVETAQTGVPFGQRFDNVYAPMRLVLAIALLVPTYYGYNSGQFLTLQMAKLGSSLATNAWRVHNNVILNTPYGGDNPMGLTTKELIVAPKVEDIGSMVSFYQLAHACRAAYKYQYSDVGDSSQPKNIEAYYVKEKSLSGVSQSRIVDSSISFDDVMTFFEGGSFKIVFGELSQQHYKDYPGNVKPYCGSMSMQIDSVDYDGAREMYQSYYDFALKWLWEDPDIVAYGDKTALIYFKERGNAQGACGVNTVFAWGSTCQMDGTTCNCKPAGAIFSNRLKMDYQAYFGTMMQATIDAVRSNTSPVQLRMTDTIINLGWAGAGIWFTRLAEYNGAFVTAAQKVPQPASFPAVMEWTQRQKYKNQPGGKPSERFSPNLKEGDTIDTFWQNSDLDVAAVDMGIAKFLDQTYRQLDDGDLTQDASERLNKNPAMNVINSIFGLTGLYEMKRNIEVNPISRLAALGKSIIEKSITYMGGALVISGVGGIMGAFDKNFTQAFSAVSGLVSSIAFSALSVGFIFYYLIPMMPFLYFFFAVGRWLKAVFEAMVAVPIWAIAHLKINAEGMVGPAAANGYFLMLEIMIRPILTLFGLLLSFSVFTAMVVILDTIFNVVVANVGGYNPNSSTGAVDPSAIELARSALDEFIYTIIYCIIVYLIGTSCFKLIDQIPNSILRWFGAGVSSFNGGVPDLMGNLSSKTMAGVQYAEGIYGATNQGVGNISGAVGNAIGSLKNQQGAGGAARAEIDQAKQAATQSRMQNNSQTP